MMPRSLPSSGTGGRVDGGVPPLLLIAPHGRSGSVCWPRGQSQGSPHLPRLLPDTHLGKESRRDGISSVYRTLMVSLHPIKKRTSSCDL